MGAPDAPWPGPRRICTDTAILYILHGSFRKLKAYAVRLRQWKKHARIAAVREYSLLGEMEQAIWKGDGDALHRIQKELQSLKAWGPQRFSSAVQAVEQRQSEEAGVGSKNQGTPQKSS